MSRPDDDESVEGKSQVGALNHALGETQKMEVLNPLKTLVNAVLVERDRRAKLVPDSV